jgi:3'(2'), 5'-bisphosphate nucleotidase
VPYPADWLPALRDLALAAAREIDRIGPSDQRRKADGSPVTAADMAAETIITVGLARMAPDIPILSEEAVPPTVGVIGRFWCVDPLDGTRDFVAGHADHVVSLALIADSVPVLGVLAAPATGVAWTGGVGTPAMRWRDGDGQPIQARAMPASGPVALVSRSNRDGVALEAWLARAGVSGRRIVGSALKFALLAEGEADLYPRFGATSEWDTAGGQAVLTAAGGRVASFDGSVLTYGKPGAANPPFLAHGDVAWTPPRG